MNHIVTATCREELLEAIEALKTQVLDWGYPVRTAASIQLDVGHGTLMAHSYPAGDANSGLVHGFVIRAMYEVDKNDLYVTSELNNFFLEQKLAVSVDDGVEISHVFHRGPHPNARSGVSYIDFSVRMTDDEAAEMLLRDMKGVDLMRVNGPYRSTTINPDHCADWKN